MVPGNSDKKKKKKNEKSINVQFNILKPSFLMIFVSVDPMSRHDNQLLSCYRS